MRFFLAAMLLPLSIFSWNLATVYADENERLLAEAVSLAAEVKEFEKKVGIEPSMALTRSSLEKPSRSILWIWLQRFGTLALHTPMDSRTEMVLSTAREQAPLERFYQFGNYSVYFRQGNEFGDAESVITSDFAKESLARKVEVLLHEDLHDDKNFDLVWEYEESLVNPLGILAALEYFETKGDHENAKLISSLIQEKRVISRELNTLTQQAMQLFQVPPLADARNKVRDLLPSYPAYYRYYYNDLQALGEANPIDLVSNHVDKTLVLEAKISHDFAYYRFFDRIVALYDKRGRFRPLIEDLKQLNKKLPDLKVSRGTMNDGLFENYFEVMDSYLGELEKTYNDSVR